MPVRTGAQYLAGLSDGREVWCSGEQIADVAGHPLLGRTARTIAELYDLQSDPSARDVLTYTSAENGDRAAELADQRARRHLG